MKRFSIIAAVSISLYSASSSPSGAQDNATGAAAAAAAAAPSQNNGSYAFGARFASQFRPGEIDIDEFIAGFRDQLGGADLRLEGEALNAAFMAWQKSVERKRADERSREGLANLQKAEAFLTENGSKEGVKTTESGLQYSVIEKGEGASPKDSDKVRVHYHGTFMDGEVFDSSKDGQPFETAVGGVIKGWQEGLQLMSKGSKYRFFIHPSLAYGERGNARIPANSLLIFDVEMLDILGSKRVQAVTPPVAIPPLRK